MQEANLLAWKMSVIAESEFRFILDYRNQFVTVLNCISLYFQLFKLYILF